MAHKIRQPVRAFLSFFLTLAATLAIVSRGVDARKEIKHSPPPPSSSSEPSSSAPKTNVRHVSRLMTKKVNGNYSPQQIADYLKGNGNTTSGNSAAGSGGKARFAWPGLSLGTFAGPVKYHGGPVMTNHVNVHVIYYGSWYGRFGQSVLEGLIGSINSKAVDKQSVPSAREWWQIMAPYYMSSGRGNRRLAMDVRLGSSVTVNRGFRTSLSDGLDGGRNDILDIIQTQISWGNLPEDRNGLYFVITSGEINVGPSDNGFCTSYCGFHNIGYTRRGMEIKYSFVGDGTQQCNRGCGHNRDLGFTPNGFYRIDSLLSTLMHELAEAASNPDVSTGWYSEGPFGLQGYENADLCNGFYRDQKVNSFPKKLVQGLKQYYFNIQGLKGQKYLLQANVDVNTQKCVLRR